MGRRKIEIKAIKDDRNRSVTFLKRKGGLFKKAHELSVLCSVDVAVIIFGNNKKLYEYSSSDMGEILTRYQYYGGANEHKGPADFSGKGKEMDDDDEDDGSGMSQHGASVEPQMMAPQFQTQPPYQHIRHATPSASPPIPNGVFPHHSQQSQLTPQPLNGPASRPSSRNAPQRHSSNLVPQGAHHPPPQNGYAYMPNPAIYNPHNGPTMPPHPHGLPPHLQGPPMQGPSGQGPQYPNYGPPPPHHQQQVQQLYVEEQQRRASMPPAFPPQERSASRPEPSPPQPQPEPIPQQQQQQQQQQQPQQQQPHPPPPSAPKEEADQLAPASQQLLEPVKRMSVKSRSIFTPIDESRSILSQHWASSAVNAENPKSDSATSSDRSQSVDVGAVARNGTKPPSPPPRSQTHHKNRHVSMSSTSSMREGFTPPSRTNSAPLGGGGGKRPVLKVQIPDEPSDGGSNTADSNSSPRSSTNVAPRKKGPGNEHTTSVVLPPPSPSASALLSAGASGPPNPFARPHPVSQSSTNSNNNNMIDTPVSALPSRFMTNDFLPSPSSFYPEWNFSGRESHTLPSPLNFATPVVGTGPSFLREDSGERAGERQGSQGGPGGISKRKTPEPEEGGDSKRMKHDGWS